MYHYFRCKRNPVHVAGVLEVSGAYATPNCPQCGGPMIGAGEGTAPLPPPTLPPAPGPLVLVDADEVKRDVMDAHPRIGNVEWLLKVNEAQQAAMVEVIYAGGKKPVTVRFHSTLLGGFTDNSFLSAPIGSGGGTAYWHTLATKSDQMNRLAAILSAPVPMDGTIRFKLKLGNAKFGFVHMIVGHHDDFRTLTTAGVVTVSVGGGSAIGSAAIAKEKQAQAELEQYRSYLALQAGLQACLSAGSLQAIYQDTTNPAKWIFVGLWGAHSFIVVAQKEGVDYNMTTLYIGSPAGVTAAAGTGQRKAAWKRNQAKLPPGW